MDSLKLNRGSSPKVPSVPVAIKFIAGEESVEDITHIPRLGKNIVDGGGGSESLSSSPVHHHHHHNDDSNWRKDFLQGNFFGRKRSGSIDGSQSLTNSLITNECNTISSASSSSSSSMLKSNQQQIESIGTWKLIKGKVSQAMEDIKSNKCDQQHSTSTAPQTSSKLSDLDSDVDSIMTINSLISDDFTEILTTKNLDNKTRDSTKKLKQHQHRILPGPKIINSDSDSDLDTDLLLTGQESDPSVLKKSFDNLRNRRGTTRKLFLSKNNSAGDSIKIGSTAPQQSQRTLLIRRRKKDTSLTSTSLPSSIKNVSSSTNTRNESEIESGVELTEEMMFGDCNNDTNESTIIIDNKLMDKCADKNELETTITSSTLTQPILSTTITTATTTSQLTSQSTLSLSLINCLTLLKHCYKHRSIIFVLFIIIINYFNDIPPFIQGILTCLSIISIISYLSTFIYHSINLWFINWLNNKINNASSNVDDELRKSQTNKFSIPNYRKMSAIKIIPPINEYKQLKCYMGWMNEIINYDPSNYHTSMTRSIYCKLNGSILRISQTNFRIPKRAMWNEQIIDTNAITFTKHRYYNLLHANIEMCPRGLARKRYFSRKYPIQLTIKSTDGYAIKIDDIDGQHLMHYHSSLDVNDDREKLSSTKIIDTSATMTNIEKQSITGTTFTSDVDGIESNDISATNVQNFDFATTILLSDLNKLQDHEMATSSAASSIQLSTTATSTISTTSTTTTPTTTPTASTTTLYTSITTPTPTPSSSLTPITTTPTSTSSNLNKCRIPCGDDIRLLLFARSDREKEDWYRRFLSASYGTITEQEFQFSDMITVNENDIAAVNNDTSLSESKDISPPSSQPSPPLTVTTSTTSTTTTATISGNVETTMTPGDNCNNSTTSEQQAKTSNLLFDGLLMTSCAARCPADYIRFMSRYQNACAQKKNPVLQLNTSTDGASRKTRREKKQEDELWKGIDQSLYLGPSGSVVWANVLIGRILFSCLNDAPLLKKMQEFLQKKLSAIKLPSFMEEVIIAQVNLGDTPPLIHRVSQPLLDERGTWIDADITYEGLMHMTITTKLNLLRLKRQQQHNKNENVIGSTLSTNATDIQINTIQSDIPTAPTTISLSDTPLPPPPPPPPKSFTNVGDAIYDSNAESSGASSSESDSPNYSNIDNLSHNSLASTSINDGGGGSGGGSKKFLRIVDRITASNLFQSATEFSYIQKAMENMSTKIRLSVELKGLIARLIINIPAPPSDRIWISFRGPPRLWITATPAVGEHTFDWTIVTNAIENKLCEEVTKYLVYPNMVDMIVPFLGQSTYKE